LRGKQKEKGTTMSRRLYNLTLHYQSELSAIYKDSDEWQVEVNPRLKPIKDMQNWPEIKGMVLNAITDIPHGSAVLIGGSSQVCTLLAELEFFQLFYITKRYDNSLGKAVPTGVNTHEGWSRDERFQASKRLEPREIKGKKGKEA
jgi:hypothetical protein